MTPPRKPDEQPASLSSPPCYLHELEPTAAAEPAHTEDWPKIRTWRKQQRERLISERTALTPDERREFGALAKERLAGVTDLSKFRTMGIYWPIRGEMDVRDIARAHIEAGGIVGLPVVVRESAPVEFWRWYPGIRMSRGIWNIPVPAERDILQPDVLLIPLVGFDRAGYRLGYGGGYYDRTIASAPKQPLLIGLGYARFELETIFPQPHDIPMDVIVTEQFVRQVSDRAAQAAP